MKLSCCVITFLFFVHGTLYSQPGPLEEGWLGLTVFKSTKNDVDRALSVKSEKIVPIYNSYRTKDGLIHFVFSEDPCSNEENGRFNVPLNTILEYDVRLSTGIALTELKWNKDLYETFLDPHQKGISIYNNAKNGVLFQTSLQNGVEVVFNIRFSRPKKVLDHLECKNSGKDLQGKPNQE